MGFRHYKKRGVWTWGPIKKGCFTKKKFKKENKWIKIKGAKTHKVIHTSGEMTFTDYNYFMNKKENKKEK